MHKERDVSQPTPGQLHTDVFTLHTEAFIDIRRTMSASYMGPESQLHDVPIVIRRAAKATYMATVVLSINVVEE